MTFFDLARACYPLLIANDRPDQTALAEINFRNATTVSLLESLTFLTVSATAGILSFNRRSSSSLDRLSKSTPAHPLSPNTRPNGTPPQLVVGKSEDGIGRLERKELTAVSSILPRAQSIAQRHAASSHRRIDYVGQILFHTSILRLVHRFNIHKPCTA